MTISITQSHEFCNYDVERFFEDPTNRWMILTTTQNEQYIGSCTSHPKSPGHYSMLCRINFLGTQIREWNGTKLAKSPYVNQQWFYFESPREEVNGRPYIREIPTTAPSRKSEVVWSLTSITRINKQIFSILSPHLPPPILGVLQEYFDPTDYAEYAPRPWAIASPQTSPTEQPQDAWAYIDTKGSQSISCPIS